MNAKFTLEQVTEIIKKWAEEKTIKGDIQFDKDYCKHTKDEDTLRFTTSNLTKWIPENTDGKESDFGNSYNYAYEIVCMKTKIKLRLAFGYQKISGITKKRVDEVITKYRKKIVKEYEREGSYRRAGKYIKGIDDCHTEEDICKTMDEIFYRMMGYEEFIIFKLEEAEKA